MQQISLKKMLLLHMPNTPGEKVGGGWEWSLSAMWIPHANLGAQGLVGAKPGPCGKDGLHFHPLAPVSDVAKSCAGQPCATASAWHCQEAWVREGSPPSPSEESPQSSLTGVVRQVVSLPLPSPAWGQMQPKAWLGFLLCQELGLGEGKGDHPPCHEGPAC